MDRKEIAAVLASAGLRPQHQFGQNFMVDQNILGAIADAGEIGAEDVVLEVGPGVGNLTRQLARRASRGAVLAVDIDYKLMPAAQRHHADLTNVTWLQADVLAGKHAVEPRVLEGLRDLRKAHPGGKLKLVSNLPYNAASPLVAELLVEMWREGREGLGSRVEGIGEGGLVAGGTRDGGSGILAPLFFERLAFTVQWEVGMRMKAVPDTRDYGPLGILIQAMAGVEVVRKIPAGAFWPPPKIQSALVVVRPDAEKMGRVRDAVGLQLLLQGIFSHRRQTLGNGLKHYLGERWEGVKGQVVAAGFELGGRAEALGVEAFLRLGEVVG